GGTLSTAVRLLVERGFARPSCVGVHAVFVGDAAARLQAAGVSQVVTCDTLTHASNRIAVGGSVAEAVNDLCLEGDNVDGGQGSAR
ncbi:MAG: phosphoribosylpyrophosphate synthetase, partial [Caldimonas sp.]